MLFKRYQTNERLALTDRSVFWLLAEESRRSCAAFGRSNVFFFNNFSKNQIRVKNTYLS